MEDSISMIVLLIKSSFIYSYIPLHWYISPSIRQSACLCTYLPTYLLTDKVILSSSYAQVDSYHEYVWGPMAIQSHTMSTRSSCFSYLRNLMLPLCLTFWTDQKWGHSSHKNWPIILTGINMYWEQSPKSHWEEDHYPVKLLCPAHRPQLPGYAYGPPGLPHLWSPTSHLLTDSIDSYFLTSLPTLFPEPGWVCRTGKKRLDSLVNSLWRKYFFFK